MAWAHEFHVTSVLFCVCRGRNWDKGSWSYLANCYQLSLIYFLTLETIWWHLFLTFIPNPLDCNCPSSLARDSKWLWQRGHRRGGQQEWWAARCCYSAACQNRARPQSLNETRRERWWKKARMTPCLKPSGRHRGAASCWGRRGGSLSYSSWNTWTTKAYSGKKVANPNSPISAREIKFIV